MTPIVPASTTGLMTIDLGRIAANWRALRHLVSPAACAAVVKADAYGLGADRVIPALVAAGCKTFFVATAKEAALARTLAPEAELFVLDGLLPGSAQSLFACCATPILASLDEVREFASLAREADTKFAAGLQVDTGLNRLGLSPDDIAAALSDGLFEALNLVLVMSHLASADVAEDPKNAAQLEAFQAALKTFPGVRASLAASDGLLLGAPFHFDLVRPGYALYGGQASTARRAPVSDVVKVEARVLQVRDVAPGESVGYSATWRATSASRIAIIAAGYEDGLPRALSRTTDDASDSYVLFGSIRAPIVGRVSMDLITVEVTDVSPAIRRGDLATLIGGERTLEAVGHAAGTIGYELLTRLGSRFHRHYIEGTR